MYKLFLDIGNSFVKWSSVVQGDYIHQNSIKLEHVLGSELTMFEEYGVPAEVYISSVADAASVDALKLIIQERWQVFPVQLSSQKLCCGLVNGYDDFSQLGDDRWFAMLGAIGIYSEPVIVVDAGTALTVDAVIDGKHQGGFIVPGLHGMRMALANSTADLSNVSATTLVNNDETVIQALASNTDSAILGGTLYMSAAFLNQLIGDLNDQFQTVFKVLLTGGEALQFSSLLDVNFDYIPDLVLQGMVNVEESVKK